MGAVAVDLPVEWPDPDDSAELIPPEASPTPMPSALDTEVIAFDRVIFAAREPEGVICHGPRTLVEADLVRGRVLTSYPSVRSGIRNAGGAVVDRAADVDDGLESSPSPTNCLPSARGSSRCSRAGRTRGAPKTARLILIPHPGPRGAAGRAPIAAGRPGRLASSFLRRR